MKNLPIIVFLLTGIAGQNVSADQVQLILQHDGVSRSYQLYIPSSYQKGDPTPLLMALHGRPGNAQRMADLTSFNARADQHGFIVVYPQGMQQYWNYLHGILGYRQHPNDSDFLLKVVVKDMQHYEKFLLGNLTRLTGVTGVHSSFVLRHVVKKTALPLDQLA